MPENKAYTLVAYMRIKEVDTSLPLYPPERHEEVTGCKNAGAKQEKYLVWKLLEKVVTDRLNLDFANLQFAKNENGKWTCPDFYFSLSHADGLVCVAVSGACVGVDTERVHEINTGLKARILTGEEISYMEGLSSSEQSSFLLESWVKKESIFKKSGGKMMLPNTITTSEHHTALKRVELDGCQYVISVSCDPDDEIEFKHMEEI